MLSVFQSFGRFCGVNKVDSWLSPQPAQGSVTLFAALFAIFPSFVVIVFPTVLPSLMGYNFKNLSSVYFPEVLEVHDSRCESDPLCLLRSCLVISVRSEIIFPFWPVPITCHFTKGPILLFQFRQNVNAITNYFLRLDHLICLNTVLQYKQHFLNQSLLLHWVAAKWFGGITCTTVLTSKKCTSSVNIKSGLTNLRINQQESQG